MHIHFLDPYRNLTSPVHVLDGRVKFLLSVAFILTVSLVPNGAWPVYLLLLSLILSVQLISGLGVGYVLRRSTLALPFMLAGAPLLVTVAGTELISLHFGAWSVVATVEGLERFATVAVKSWLSVQSAIVLASATPFPDLLQAMRSVHIPRLLVAMFGLMWRYLFVLADEAIRLMRARAARSGTSLPSTRRESRSRSGGSLAWRARVTGGMAGNLFLRAFERSERIYMAMLSRGYDGEVRTISPAPLAPGQGAVLAAGLFFLALLLALAILFWG